MATYNRVTKPEITVHIPVYNGGKFLARTLNSLLEQEFRDFEALCVDDCSTDDSLQILRGYAANDVRVRVFRTASNLGSAPPVLKHSLEKVRGKMWVYSSQDDLFSKNWLNAMVSCSKKPRVDAVLPEVVLFFGDGDRRNLSLRGLNGDTSKILSGREAFELSLDWQIPGNALFSSKVVKTVGFHTFGMNSDEYTYREYFLRSKAVAFSGGTFFYMQDNPKAITKSLSKKSMDIPYTELRLWNLGRLEGFSRRIVEPLLVRSVISLVRYTALSFSSRGSWSSREGVARCLLAYRELEAAKYLASNEGLGLRTLVAKLALRNEAWFYFLAIGVFLFRPLGILGKAGRIRTHT